MRYLRVKNWEKFQYPSPKPLPWIKFFTALLSPTKETTYSDWSDHTKALLHHVWLMARVHNGRIPESWLTRERLNLKTKVNLQPLLDAGFVWFEDADDAETTDSSYDCSSENTTNSNSEPLTRARIARSGLSESCFSGFDSSEGVQGEAERILARLTALKLISSRVPDRFRQLCADWSVSPGADAVIAAIDANADSIRAADRPAQYLAAIVRNLRKAGAPADPKPEEAVAPISRSEAALTFATRTAWPIVAECGDPDTSDIARRKFNQQSGLTLDPGDADQWAKWVRVCNEVGLDPKGRRKAS